MHTQTSRNAWRYRETTDEEWLLRISDVVEKVWKAYKLYEAHGLVTGFAAMKNASEGVAADLKALASNPSAFLERLRAIAADHGQMKDRFLEQFEIVGPE